VHPGRLYGLAQILGVAATAWATEGFARALGARPPWSLLAGAAAFSGLTSTALLEGYVYHALAPWLPLFIWTWWLACGLKARPWHGLLAGVFFCLTLLTTAYLGLAAALAAVCFAAAALARSRRRPIPWVPMLAAAAVVAPVAALSVAQFMEGTDSAALSEIENTWRLYALEGSAHLVAISGPTPAADQQAHSMNAATPAALLCLALAAPVALRGERGWRIAAATAFVALVLSMGPALGSPGRELAPLPLAVFEWLPGRSFMRFPARLGWVWVVCGGAVAGLVATRLGQRAGRPALALFAFALVDLFAVQRLPARQRTQIGATPSAYAAHEGAVFDLYPEEMGRGYEFDAWAQARSCYFQLGHGRPIANDCVITLAEDNPAWKKSRALTPLLLAGDAAGAAALLRGWRFSTVALWPDFYAAGDRARIQGTLAVLDPSPVSSTDGGEYVVAYAVPEAP
jgi:hypothetical protein